MRVGLIIACFALVAAGGVAVCASEAATSTYGAQLAEQAIVEHPGLQSLQLHVRSRDGKTNAVVGAGGAPVSGVAAQAYIDAVSSSASRVAALGSATEVVLPLHDVDGKVIGACVLRFSAQPGRKTDEVIARGERVRDELRRRTFDADNLLEPYPYVAGLPSGTYAQHLVDRVLAAHADVRVIALHAPPPHGGDSVILGSSFGRIGKADDAGDLLVIRTGEPNMRVNATGERFNLGLPLRDASGSTVGLMTVAFAYRLGQDIVPLLRKAESIRDQLAKQITRVETLGKQHVPDGSAGTT